MRATVGTFSLAGLLGAAALVAGLSAASAQVEYKPAQGTPKHAVIIFVDGLRADLFDPELAPHIAALGRVGVRFANAEVGFPSDSMPGILGPVSYTHLTLPTIYSV